MHACRPAAVDSKRPGSNQRASMYGGRILDLLSIPIGLDTSRSRPYDFACSSAMNACMRARAFPMHADTPGEDILSVLYDALEYIDDAMSSGGRILVHCSQARRDRTLSSEDLEKWILRQRLSHRVEWHPLLLTLSALIPLSVCVCACWAQGVSRSATLVIAYLMWKSGHSYDQVFAQVKEARGVANPNIGEGCLKREKRRGERDRGKEREKSGRVM